MSRNSVTKADLLIKIYKMKTNLYDGGYILKSLEWRQGANEILSELIEHLKEYRL